eukprot:scaffold361490_cov53-Prasinocladus_malaysianus.AAC.1
MPPPSIDRILRPLREPTEGRPKHLRTCVCDQAPSHRLSWMASIYIPVAKKGTRRHLTAHVGPTYDVSHPKAKS